MSDNDRRTVKVDPSTFAVFSETGSKRIGTVLSLTVNEANRTPTGGRYTSRRLTVRLREDDERLWVGQVKNTEWERKTHRKTVILHPKPEE